jgi:hypothetical protein
MNQHPDPCVQDALSRLNDALCTWERATGRQSVLILREQGGFVARSVNGKPVQIEDISDRQLLHMVE